MKSAKFPVGTKLKLVHGTSLWAQYHVHGRGDLIYEVVKIVDDLTCMERVSLRAQGEVKLSFNGITPDLFKKFTGEIR